MEDVQEQALRDAADRPVPGRIRTPAEFRVEHGA